MQEIWKPVKGFSHYYVSNLGRLKTKTHRIRFGRYNHAVVLGKHLKQTVDNSGYKCITLWKSHYRNYTFRVHRLVAQAFVANPNHYPQVNHKDENPLNNRASNLEWCTNWYNSHYGHHGQHISESNQHPKYRVALSRHGHTHRFDDAMQASHWLIKTYLTESKPKTVEKDICCACRCYPKRRLHVYGYQPRYLPRRHINRDDTDDGLFVKDRKTHQWRPKHVRIRYFHNRRHQKMKSVEFKI